MCVLCSNFVTDCILWRPGGALVRVTNLPKRAIPGNFKKSDAILHATSLSFSSPPTKTTKNREKVCGRAALDVLNHRPKARYTTSSSLAQVSQVQRISFRPCHLYSGVIPHLAPSASPSSSNPSRPTDRIIGDILQLDGAADALRSLGPGACLERIGAIPVRGHAVLDAGQPRTHTPHTPPAPKATPSTTVASSRNLRASAKAAPGVDVLEATLTYLIECPLTRRVFGRARAQDWRRTQAGVFLRTSSSSPMTGFSNFCSCRHRR
jgi:hypothetical protein